MQNHAMLTAYSQIPTELSLRALVYINSYNEDVCPDEITPSTRKVPERC